MSHTYAIVNVSTSTYREIEAILERAGYTNQFHDGEIIDMHGLAIQRDTSHDEDCMDCGQKPNVCQCG